LDFLPRRGVAGGFAADLSGARSALSIRCDAPVVGRWDSSRLEHLVKSLLSNAIKFGAGKPIEILVARPGAGSTFTVELPCAGPPGTAPSREEEAAAEQAKPARTAAAAHRLDRREHI
jgi:hypothetical protein